MQRTINVAVAVIQRKDGYILFTERPAGKACAGEWEFPGGKVEAGETPRQALSREIEEELVDLDDVESIASFSSEGLSVININFTQSVPDMVRKTEAFHIWQGPLPQGLQD